MRKNILVLVAAIMTAFITAAMVAYVPVKAADAAWTASYWKNVNLKGNPVVTQAESSVKYNWGKRSPIPGTINTDKFSARWTRTVSFDQARYLFRVTSDDGIRVWVDNKKILDQWDEHALQTAVIPVDMTAGDHAIKVEYFENKGDATAIVNWATVSGNPWKVQYFKNTGLNGKPAVTRNENVLNYHWNASRPAPSIPANKFSGRWTRTEDLAAGKYKFKVTAGGGFRLYLDGKVIMNEWYDHAGSTSKVTIKVGGGSHKIRLDYYNHAAPAILVMAIKPM